MYRLLPVNYYEDLNGTDGAEGVSVSPSPEHLTALEGALSRQEAEAEVTALLKEMMGDVKGQIRKTEWGLLIISTPSASGQDM